MKNETFNGTKVLYMLISVLVAIVIWGYVDNDKDYTSTISLTDVPVEFIGENTTLADRGLMLLDDTERTVSFKLEGSKRVLMKLDTSAIRVQVDLEKENVTTTGVQDVRFSVSFPTGFTNGSKVSMKPVGNNNAYMVSIDVGELYSKTVDIRCEIQGKVADGYIAGEIQFQPSVLELRGQETVVEKVSYAKVVLPIGDAQETVSQTLRYQLCDAAGNVVDSSNIHPVTDEVQVTLPVYVVKELPLVVNFLESPGSSASNINYSIEPRSIIVSGDATLLRDVDSIKLDDFDLSAISSQGTYYYQIPLPDGCENLSSVTRATVTVSFKDLVTSTLNVSGIEYENIPEGKTVTSLTGEVPVTLRGTSGDVGAVTPDDVVIVADLRDVGSASGSYTVPVTVRVDTAGDVGVVGSYQIRITVSDQEPPEEEPGSNEDENV